MQTIIRTGTAQEQIDAANKNLDRLGGDLRSDDMKGRLEFYFQARIELANAMNFQRIADSLEHLAGQHLIFPTGASETTPPDRCNCGVSHQAEVAGHPANPPDHDESCPCWAPF